MGALMVHAPIIVPLRWVGRGVDVRVHITPDKDALVYGFDVFDALGIFSDTIARHRSYPMGAVALLPGGVRFIDVVVDESHSAAALYPLERIQQITRHSPADPQLVEQLLTWLGDSITDMLNPPTAGDFVEGPDPGLKEFAAGGTYSVRRAATILARDPNLRTIGQQSLFDAMSGLGWISRELGIWIPAAKPIAEGWLLRHKVRLGHERRGERVLYPQIRVTDAGLHELHKRLGGVATLTLDERPALALLDGIA